MARSLSLGFGRLSPRAIARPRGMIAARKGTEPGLQIHSGVSFRKTMANQIARRRLLELREAIQKGLDRGEATPLRIVELKREVRRRIGRGPRTRA